MDKFAQNSLHSDDSGFASASTSISDIIYESTPKTESVLNLSRKRKRLVTQPCFDKFTPKLINLRNSLVSSTLNESVISKSLEQCNISSVASNLYNEQSTFTDTSVPSQSQAQTTNFYQTHHGYVQKTPTKCVSLQKLGSPERNKILYGELKSNSISKVLSPKFDVSFKRTTSVKKRLFNGKIDPVNALADRRCFFIIEEIFSYLSDADLYRCKMVSKLWSKILSSDRKASGRLNSYVQNKMVNKENCFVEQKEVVDAIANSPMKATSMGIFYKIGKTLKDGQRLDKCPSCLHVTIIDNNIGQCQNDNCGYIYCQMCNSFSTSGPETFKDACMQSSLLVEKRPYKSPLLCDSPIKNDNSFPSFLFSTPNKFNVSNYSSGTSATSSINSTSSKTRRSVLSINNQESPKAIMKTPLRNKTVSVVPMKITRSIDIVEPSSPPKIKCIAGSKASKKNLKRLLL